MVVVDGFHDQSKPYRHFCTCNIKVQHLGHRHEIENKVRSIEKIDEEILGPVIGAMREDGEEFSILLMPDHPTPLDIRTHTAEPVPFVLYRSFQHGTPFTSRYTELLSGETGLFVENGYTMMDRLIKG